MVASQSSELSADETWQGDATSDLTFHPLAFRLAFTGFTIVRTIQRAHDDIWISKRSLIMRRVLELCEVDEGGRVLEVPTRNC